MKKFKILVLSLLPVFWMFCFCNWQFDSTVDWTSCSSSYCSFDDFTSISSSPWNFSLTVNCTYWDYEFSFYRSWLPITIDKIESYCLNSAWPLNKSKWFKITKAYNDEFSSFLINYSSSTMPVSSLTPIINWLSSSINEFIPYVSFIWIWVLSILIWFFVVRWFINWCKRSVLSPFK